MVQKGQFLERPTLIPVGGVVLEGLSHRGTVRPPLLIVPPPPDEGGSMDHVVAAEAAWACATRGHPTLRFNFQGVGGSQGERGPRGLLLADAEEALRLLEENVGPGEVACLSIGSGAQVVVELARRHPEVCGLCLVSPHPKMDSADFEGVRVPVLVIVGALSSRPPGGGWAELARQPGGRVVEIADADQAFTRNLAEVGRSIAGFLDTLRPR